MNLYSTNHHRKPGIPPAISGPEPFDRVLARLLDREADRALQFGYRAEAERLAHRAAELREAAQ